MKSGKTEHLENDSKTEHLENGEIITYDGQRDKTLEEKLRKSLETRPEKAFIVIKKVKINEKV